MSPLWLDIRLAVSKASGDSSVFASFLNKPELRSSRCWSKCLSQRTITLAQDILTKVKTNMKVSG